MKILFDQGTPAPLRRALAAHQVSLAAEMGWENLANGELLRAAEAVFDLLVTTDQSLRHQQNLTGRRLAILVLPVANWLLLREHAPAIARDVETLRPGDYVEWLLPPVS